jgi:hypothetical protein
MPRIPDTDDNEFSGRAPYGDAKVRARKADFDRNRDGLYGGLPKTRDRGAPGPTPSDPHPATAKTSKKRKPAK